ncbi:hypothetical protein GHT06_018270 [Daphnia sinensis]|uniref:VTT domain-containing protein n=1 Tax=Daphnia sinensis TaxID=1820382 RepID=A0AAD5L5P7_9CRUS|nr:hypothetical protein GHT06_018270 [Daphnia sinensis]
MGPPSPFKSTTAVFSLDEENNYSSLNTISLNRSSFVSGPMCQCLLSLLTLAIMACFVFLFRDSIYHVLLWIEKQDTWVTCIMFTALFTIVSLPLTWGYILLNLACGYLFGMLAGILVVSTTAAVGVFFAHVIVKQLCLGFITTKLLNSHSLRAFVNVISGPQAFKVVAFARLTPIPFGLQNAIFAGSSIGVGRYMLATALGLLPTQVINVYLGSTLRSMRDVLTDDNTATTGYVVFCIQVAISIGLMTYVVRRAKQELQKIVLLTTNTLHKVELGLPDEPFSNKC